MVNLKIDGIDVQVPEGTTILEAAKTIGIKIPTLCYLKDVNAIGACRMCVVEVARARALQAACVYPVSNGMEVKTHSPAVIAARKLNLELILSNHDRRCLECTRNQTCELQKLAEEHNIDMLRYPAKTEIDYPVDALSPSIERDPKKCVLCRRCVATCRNVQKIGVIGAINRGYKTIISPAFDMSIADVPCINCGQCIVACPVGALREKDSTQKVWDALADPDKYVVVQPAPAVRAGLGECFGLPMGTSVTGKMAAALRRLGFDKVFDTDFAADLTIMEEGTELLGRITNGGVLPMITSCSPGWIKYCEHYYPDFLAHLSSCKSPHEMMGAVIKSYFAEKNNIDPANIYVVSVMPCTAKKYECQRPELAGAGYEDVDAVITTRELGKMIKNAGIDFVNLPDEDFDDMLGDSTGAAVIFGATGGVMEAALRTVADVLTGKDLPDIDYTAVRGLEGVKYATVKINDMDVNVAIAHGTGNAKVLMDKLAAGELKDMHFIEVMGCPGGCVTGGGQPFVPAAIKNEVNVSAERAKALYGEDAGKGIRKSHKNPSIVKIYEEYFEKPNSHKAHELLHTTYTARKRYL